MGSRRYPVSEDTKIAIMKAIDEGIFIQHKIAVYASKLLGKVVGQRTAWQGIKYLVEDGLVKRVRGADTDHGRDYRMLTYALTHEGMKHLNLVEA